MVNQRDIADGKLCFIAFAGEGGEIYQSDIRLWPHLPSRLNNSPSNPAQNRLMDSAISYARWRRASGRLLSRKGQTARRGCLGQRLALFRIADVRRRDDGRRIIARSGQVRRASSLASPPVIISRAVISISPSTSRWSSPSLSSSSGGSASVTACSTSRHASANRGR